MTDQQQSLPNPERGDLPPPGAPALVNDPAGETLPGQPAVEDTVGTGTSIALGCIAGTLLLVVIGLIFLLIVWLIG